MAPRDAGAVVRTNETPVVCFDLGGVVVRICRSWAHACERAGVPLREPDRFAQPDIAARRRAITHEHQTGRLNCDDYYASIARFTSGLYSPDEVRAVHEAWLIDDYPGLPALIDWLNSTGVVTACLSNTNHAHWVRLAGLNTPAISRAVPRLAVKMVSHELGHAKPHEEIYALAERRLNAPPHRIVFFDDLHENIDAARSRGWRAHRIDPEGDTAAQIRGFLRTHGLMLPDPATGAAPA